MIIFWNLFLWNLTWSLDTSSKKSSHRVWPVVS